MHSRARAAIVDDHPVFRQGLRSFIAAEARFEIVGEAGDGESCLELVRQRNPELLVLDISLPGLNGLEIARRLQMQRSPVRIILLTMHKEEDLFNQALNLDVKGFVLKENAISEILACLDAVANGEYYLTASMSSSLLRRRKRAAALESAEPNLNQVTTAERRILRLIGDNRTSKEIGQQLCISYRTVEAHRANICTKLGLHGSHRLLQFAIQHQSEL